MELMMIIKFTKKTRGTLRRRIASPLPDVLHKPESGQRGWLAVGASYLYLLSSASVTHYFATPLESTAAATDNIHHLSEGVETAAITEIGALVDLFSHIGGVGVHAAGPALHALKAKLRIHAAIIGGGVGKDKLPLLDLPLLLLLGCPPVPLDTVGAACL